MYWHGGGSGAWQLHGFAAGAEVNPQHPDPLTKPELATVWALCFTWLYQTIAEYCESWKMLSIWYHLYTMGSLMSINGDIPNGERECKKPAR
jgi:hypothetical protein